MKGGVRRGIKGTRERWGGDLERGRERQDSKGGKGREEKVVGTRQIRREEGQTRTQGRGREGRRGSRDDKKEG